MGQYKFTKTSFIITGSQKTTSRVDKPTTKHTIQKYKKPSEKLKTHNDKMRGSSYIAL